MSSSTTRRFSQADRNARRRQMAELVASGKTIGEVAAYFGVHPETVRQSVSQFKSITDAHPTPGAHDTRSAESAASAKS